MENKNCLFWASVEKKAVKTLNLPNFTHLNIISNENMQE